MNGDGTTVSSKGARGLMQMMPSTAKNLVAKYGLDPNILNNLDDPDTNIMLSALLVQELTGQYGEGNIDAILGAYNGGGNGANPKTRVAETRNYVAKGVSIYNALKQHNTRSQNNMQIVPLQMPQQQPQTQQSTQQGQEYRVIKKQEEKKKPKENVVLSGANGATLTKEQISTIADENNLTYQEAYDELVKQYGFFDETKVGSPYITTAPYSPRDVSRYRR